MMGTIARRLPILIFAFLTTVLWGFDKKAVELNDLGYQAYEAKDYPKALEYFSFNTWGDVTMAVGIDVVPCTVVRQGRYAIMGSDLILYIKGYSQPVQCEYNTRTSGYAGERSDDFLWGKITTEGVDLSREGYGLIDSKNTTNYQCRTPVEPGPWQTAEVRSVTTGPGETGFSLRQIRFRAREQTVEAMGLLELRALASLSVPKECTDCPGKLVLISNYYVGGEGNTFLNEAFLIDFDGDSTRTFQTREIEARFSLPREGIRLWVYPVHAGAGEDVLAVARKEFLSLRKTNSPFLEVPEKGDKTRTVLAFLDWTMTLKPLGGEPRPCAKLSPPGERAVTVTGDNILQFFGIEKLAFYSKAELASLLDVPEDVLETADFIAVDHNGTDSGGGGFEGSRWTFSDGTHKETIDHQFNAKPGGAVLANLARENAGNLYNRLFGTSLAPGNDLGILLFDLAGIGIDTAAPLFTVTLAGGGKDCHTDCPEVLFLGVLNVASATAYFSR